MQLERPAQMWMSAAVPPVLRDDRLDLALKLEVALKDALDVFLALGRVDTGGTIEIAMNAFGYDGVVRLAKPIQRLGRLARGGVHLVGEQIRHLAEMIRLRERVGSVGKGDAIVNQLIGV